MPMNKRSVATRHDHDKTFCFLNLFKWLAMLLMFGIAAAEYFFNSENGINWMFIGFCVAFGILLLWVGHILAVHSVTRVRAPRTKPKTR